MKGDTGPRGDPGPAGPPGPNAAVRTLSIQLYAGSHDTFTEP